MHDRRMTEECCGRFEQTMTQTKIGFAKIVGHKRYLCRKILHAVNGMVSMLLSLFQGKPKALRVPTCPHVKCCLSET